MTNATRKTGKKLLLSIAGYDPSAGAGVLLDIAVFRGFGFFGAGILTALTAQNSRRVTGVRLPGGRFLLRQYEALVEDIEPSGIKVGMLGGCANLPALSRILVRHPGIPVVVDPIVRSSSGRWLLEKRAIPSFLTRIKGKISLLTPNLQEASILSGRRPRNPEEMKEAARRIADRIAAPCLVKGGHLAGPLADVLYDGRRFFMFRHKKQPLDVHGSGCFLSSSLLGYLVRGHPLAEACGRAVEFTQGALRRAVRLGRGRKVFFSF
jgi:hydroxymethylpyrimidine/phosphomethylpyrimidine kinase